MSLPWETRGDPGRIPQIPWSVAVLFPSLLDGQPKKCDKYCCLEYLTKAPKDQTIPCQDRLGDATGLPQLSLFLSPFILLPSPPASLSHSISSPQNWTGAALCSIQNTDLYFRSGGKRAKVEVLFCPSYKPEVIYLLKSDVCGCWHGTELGRELRVQRDKAHPHSC